MCLWIAVPWIAWYCWNYRNDFWWLMKVYAFLWFLSCLVLASFSPNFKNQSCLNYDDQVSPLSTFNTLIQSSPLKKNWFHCLHWNQMCGKCELLGHGRMKRCGLVRFCKRSWCKLLPDANGRKKKKKTYCTKGFWRMNWKPQVFNWLHQSGGSIQRE